MISALIKKQDELHERIACLRAEVFATTNRAKLDEQMYGSIIEQANNEIADLRQQVWRLTQSLKERA
jgi:hypothetical protein